MVKAKKYYVVRVGKRTGIFNTWESCHRQVDKYPGAIFKSFTNYLEAKAWFEGEDTRPFTSDPIIHPDDMPAPLLNSKQYPNSVQILYVVREGVIPGIYETWEECRKQVHGYSHAKYKVCHSRAEALAYLNDQPFPADATASDTCSVTAANETSPNQLNNATVASNLVHSKASRSSKNKLVSANLNQQLDQMIAQLNEGEVLAFVDGSYDDGLKRYGYGAMLVSHDGTSHKLCKSFANPSNPDFAKSRNVAGELEGVKAAITWASEQGKTHITIVYDYMGIEKWPTKQWKANLPLTQQYAKFVQEMEKKIKVSFFKVPAHTGITYNEVADQLAKDSLHITDD